MLIYAKDCRYKLFLKTIPGDKPGWYKWYAPIESVNVLLNSSHIEGKFFEDILPLLSKIEHEGKAYYCIYVGQAVKESIRARLDWHVNQKHTRTAVESGFLSTFRKTIASLITGDQMDEVATNDLIDTLVVDYYSVDFIIKSDEARKVIDGIERYEMNNIVSPLNIQGNKRVEVMAFKKELMRVRKNAKKG